MTYRGWKANRTAKPWLRKGGTAALSIGGAAWRVFSSTFGCQPAWALRPNSWRRHLARAWAPFTLWDNPFWRGDPGIISVLMRPRLRILSRITPRLGDLLRQYRIAFLPQGLSTILRSCCSYTPLGGGSGRSNRRLARMVPYCIPSKDPFEARPSGDLQPRPLHRESRGRYMTS